MGRTHKSPLTVEILRYTDDRDATIRAKIEKVVIPADDDIRSTFHRTLQNAVVGLIPNDIDGVNRTNHLGDTSHLADHVGYSFVVESQHGVQLVRDLGQYRGRHDQ